MGNLAGNALSCIMQQLSWLGIILLKSIWLFWTQKLHSFRCTQEPLERIKSTTVCRFRPWTELWKPPKNDQSIKKNNDLVFRNGGIYKIKPSNARANAQESHLDQEVTLFYLKNIISCIV